jgi:hypothetical protein
MNYDKPQILCLSQAAIAIHGGQQKVPCICVEGLILNLMTPPAYEADEQ